MDGSSDRRWVVLTPDGQFSTLARSLNPDDAQIQAAEAGLRRLGMGGWPCVMSGSQYADEVPSIMEVRRLGEPTATFAEAATAFRLLMDASRAR